MESPPPPPSPPSPPKLKSAEPEVVTGVLLSVLAAGLVKPGGLVVITFKDFCGGNKRMRTEVSV